MSNYPSGAGSSAPILVLQNFQHILMLYNDAGVIFHYIRTIMKHLLIITCLLFLCLPYRGVLAGKPDAIGQLFGLHWSDGEKKITAIAKERGFKFNGRENYTQKINGRNISFVCLKYQDGLFGNIVVDSMFVSVRNGTIYSIQLYSRSSQDSISNVVSNLEKWMGDKLEGISERTVKMQFDIGTAFSYQATWFAPDTTTKTEYINIYVLTDVFDKTSFTILVNTTNWKKADKL